MSASREKKARKATEAKPVVKQEPAKKGMPKAVKWVIGIVLAVVVLAIIGVSVVFSSTYFHKNSVALTVGEHEVSPAEFNYYFKEAYYNMTQDSTGASAYLSYMTDYIKEEAIQNLKEIYAVYDAAIADGYTLTEEETATLEQEFESMEATAKSMGATNTNELLAATYGKGCDVKNYRKYREMYMIATRYAQDKTNAQDFSEEALAGYYAENAEKLDTVSYRQMFLPFQGDVTATVELIESIMPEIAEDGTAMDKYALQYAPENSKDYYAENDTQLKNITKSSAQASVADWLFDSERKEGDVTYVENTDSTGFYLVRFGNFNAGYDTVNVRHILVGISTAANEEAKKAAQEKAQAYLDEFQNGNKTEESFAALAEAYSEDNAENGGLYENVYKGQMVAPFEEWCFDPAREIGDSGIVETDYGYHVMYFAGLGMPYDHLKAKNDMMNSFYETWIEEITANYTVEKNDFGMGFVTTETTSY